MQLLFTLFAILLCFFLLSLGTIFFNKRLKGSCGGNDIACTCSELEKKLCKKISELSNSKNNY